MQIQPPALLPWSSQDKDASLSMRRTRVRIPVAAWGCGVAWSNNIPGLEPGERRFKSGQPHFARR